MANMRRIPPLLGGHGRIGVYQHRPRRVVSGPQNEYQRCTFDFGALFGQGTFTAPDGFTQIVVDFEQIEAVIQAAFDTAMGADAPVISRPSQTQFDCVFSNGAYAGTDVAEMTFVSNTTDAPLNDGSSGNATIAGENGGDGDTPKQYQINVPSGVGWIVVSGQTLVNGSVPATIFADGITWDVDQAGGAGAQITITAQDTAAHTLTLDATKMGTAVTGMMSTVQQGG